MQRFDLVRQLDDFIARRQPVIAAVFAVIGVLTAIFALLGITPQELDRTLPF